MTNDDRKIVLAFDTTSCENNLNIGDRVTVVPYSNLFCIVEHNGDILAVETPGEDNETENLISYLSSKTGESFYVWPWIDNCELAMISGVILAITNNKVIVEPTTEARVELGRIDQEKNTTTGFEYSNLLATNIVSSITFGCSSQLRDHTVTYRGGEYEQEQKVEEEKEETKMFSDLNTSFGKINTDQFRLSINGLVVKGKDGKYNTFNPETRELIEVSTGFFDEAKDLLFFMPATELEVGDIIMHQGKPYYITVSTNNVIKGIDFEEAIESTLVGKTNVFGVKYYTKIFNVLGTNNILGGDMANNPMMTYALMGGEKLDISNILMIQAMNKQGGGIADFSENPMMLMALMGGSKDGNLGDFAKIQMLAQLSKKKTDAQ